MERPSDISDQATQHEERFLEAAIHKARKVVTLKATGFCLFCDDPAEVDKRFCSVECRDDWQHAQRMKKINGK